MDRQPSGCAALLAGRRRAAQPSTRSLHPGHCYTSGASWVWVAKKFVRGGDVRMTTSKGDASKASKLLSNPKTPAKVKSVAGSDLSQAKGNKKK